MPFVNPYDVALPTVEEARLLAFQAMIISSLDTLNASLNRDSASPLTFTAAQVIIGDPETVATSLICIVGGGKNDGTDMEIGQGAHEFMPRTDFAAPHLQVHTNIYVYIHPSDMIPADSGDTIFDAKQAVQYRETARARIVGHLRKRVFNSAQASVITLSSQEFNGTGYDQLLDAKIVNVKMGVTAKNTGGFMYIYSAELHHESYIQ